MTQDKIRIAVVGAGTAGSRHIAAIRNSGKARLAGVADTDAALLRRFRSPGTVCSESLTDILKEARPQGVIVATPTDFHKEPAIEALKAGASVLLEKPVATTLEDAQEIGEASQRHRRPVLVGHQRRYHRQVREAARLIQSGALGRLVMVSGIWGVRKHACYYDPEWRRRREAGPVMINLTHDIDLLRHLCGEIDELFAYAGNSIENMEKEDAVAVSLRFRSGALGAFAASDRVISPWGWEFATGENVICASSGLNCMQFLGTEASLEFPNLVLWRQDRGHSDWRCPVRSTPHEIPYEDSYVKQIEHFADVAAGRAQPLVTIQDAVPNVEAAHAVFRAAESGRSQRLRLIDNMLAGGCSPAE